MRPRHLTSSKFTNRTKYFEVAATYSLSTSQKAVIIPKMKLQFVLKRAFLLLLCSLARIFADNVIIDGPSNLTVQPGEWGNFTCSVACTHFVDWYVEGFETGEISRTCSETLSDQTACMETVQPCASQTSTAEFVSRLRVLATNEFAGMNIAVQCSAIAHTFPSPSDPCPPPYLSFSRFSSLRVRPLPEVITTTQTPTTLPSPSPVVCPSVTADVTTITETVRETVTSTVLVASTVTVSTAPTDLPQYPSKAAATHGTHFGKVVTELLTWFVTIMAGVVFL